MWVYDNDTVSDTFIVDLTKDRDVQDNLPCNFLSVRNDSSLIAFVYLDNKQVGSVQVYSADSFIGKDFEIIRIIQPDGDNFAIGDLFLQVGKNEQMSSTPYNPSWDLMEENIDLYASGCNNRVSLSAINTADIIKYLINCENNLIVQKRLSIQGSASLGTYAITFDNKTIISGGVPINGEVLDTKQYKKVIQNSEFDYSVTNATIQGWMIDYFKRDDLDITDDSDITIITDSTNVYDNDLTTSDIVAHSTSYQTLYEISFSTRTIKEYHMLSYGFGSGGAPGRLKLDANINGSWVTIFSFSSVAAVWELYDVHEIRTDNLVTGIRIQGYRNYAGNRPKVNDLTILE